MTKATVQSTKLPSMCAVGTLGLLIGLMVGLSASPVVGSLMGTLATLAIALVGNGLSMPGKQKAKDGEADTGAKNVPLKSGWLAGFCICCIIGILGGIWLRTHDVLNPSPKQQVKAYCSAGFTFEEAKAIVAEHLLAEIEVGEGKSPRLPMLFRQELQFDLDALNPERKGSATETINSWKLHDEPLVKALAREINQIRFTSETEKYEVLKAVWQAMKDAKMNADQKEEGK